MTMACSSNSMAKLSIFFLIFHFPYLAFSYNSTLELPSGGPESFIFEPNGNIFYVSINDGRIVKFAGSDIGFVSFAYASPAREFCDGTSDPDKGNICGRVIGLAPNYKSGKLNLVDAYHGLLEVGPEGGLATNSPILPAEFLINGLTVWMSTKKLEICTLQMLALFTT
ncbi:hypothetical protein ACH5RR_025059 [Cinchona calisaya]|uniref:Uncharacterized protein n=1 Tax=Cinchona calisaya TaxID=153742 RepID=A0ABD2Z2L8_9GENT